MARVQNQKTLTDLELVALMKQGEMSAMGELYQRYYRIVYGKCLTFTKDKDEAFDLAQEIMIRVIEKISSFKGKASFSTWLYSLTFNYCVDQQRKKKRIFQSEFANALPDDMVTSVEINEEEDIESQRFQLLSNINSEDKELLVLKYQYGKSIKELQEMYNLSASAVKMRLLRAKSKVANIYSEQLIPAA